MRRATSAQIRAIRARQHRLGMADTTYRRLLAERYGVTSTCDLSLGQASDLLHQLYDDRQGPVRRKPVRKPAAPPSLDQVVRLPTRAQRTLIDQLVGEVAWCSPEGYRRWLRRSLGLERVRSCAEAQRVIRGLKGLKRYDPAR